MKEEIMVQIKFTANNDETNGHGEYSDAIYMPLSEYQATSSKDRLAKQRARVANWVSVIEAPAIEEPIEELSEQVEE